MVIRFPIHIFSILLGICICLYVVLLCPSSSSKDAVTYDSPMQVLMIDPGHGGADGGAVSVDGVIESKINLDIALKLESICHLYGVNTVMTRRSETLDYPPDADTIAKMKVADQKARLRLIRDYPHGILFSIHQNSYPSDSPKGIQVLYGPAGNSRELGMLLQTNLNAALNPGSRRMATEAGRDIFLMKNCDCTVALIECGFLSNSEESKLLQTDTYQKKISAILLGSYLQYVYGV